MQSDNLEGQKGNAVAIILVVLAVVIVGGYFLMRGDSDNGSPSLSPSGSVSVTASPTPTSTVTTSKTPLGTTQQGAVKTFNVTATSFVFSLKEVRVNKGDTVKINFTNSEGLHDWVIDEFNAKSLRIQAGQTSTVTFVADKTGTFEYYCSVGNHRAQGMMGKLIVQ